MRRFHGDLLMGGLSLREIDGVIEDELKEPEHHHEGHFEVDVEKQAVLELNRPYLLMTDNGDSMKLVVKKMDETGDHSRLIVQFEEM